MSEFNTRESEQERSEKISFFASLIRGVLGVVGRAGKGDDEAHKVLEDWYKESREKPIHKGDRDPE